MLEKSQPKFWMRLEPNNKLIKIAFAIPECEGNLVIMDRGFHISGTQLKLTSLL
ncbi:hypothetical protein H1P_4290002 [Hyella patelloides LEGE 07179]|uniref:Uncharacterized protein n=1 Tax=Hyella patelloides LEGE 07179 TaxID=945734 RepID=A0A563VXX8_9CYAN|nr:hypothetical protein H1P_4290002 [Hyella patelloides LEGE 07179]